ncbi:Uncharacterised protein [Mycobacteroides abscessus subsp. abscessus]|nr:Uncharacterised protein [Mycobacteroides abscessus subsp. abscessus]
MPRGSIDWESRPSGRVTQTKKPPPGRVQVVPSGMYSSSASSIASRRWRYMSRKATI